MSVMNPAAVVLVTAVNPDSQLAGVVVAVPSMGALGGPVVVTKRSWTVYPTPDSGASAVTDLAPLASVIGASIHGVQASDAVGRERSWYATNDALAVCVQSALTEPRFPLVLMPGADAAVSVDLCGGDQCGCK